MRLIRFRRPSGMVFFFGAFFKCLRIISSFHMKESPSSYERLISILVTNVGP